MGIEVNPTRREDETRAELYRKGLAQAEEDLEKAEHALALATSVLRDVQRVYDQQGQSLVRAKARLADAEAEKAETLRFIAEIKALIEREAADREGNQE